MPDTPLNPDALEAAARAANEEGWTCFEGSGEPGNFDTCEDCQRVDKEHANAIVSAYLAVAQPEVQRKLAVSVKALGLVASLHTAVVFDLGEECRSCCIPYPCMTRRVADEALQAIEREVSP